MSFLMELLPSDSQENEVSLKVTLSLRGGQHYTIFLDPNALLLKQLFTVLFDPNAPASKMLFQIPLNNDREMLFFHSDQLVSVTTDPPILLKQNLPSKSDPGANLVTSVSSPSFDTDDSSTQNIPILVSPVSDSLRSGVIPTQYVQMEEFFSPTQYEKLLKYTLDREAEFVSTSTSSSDQSYRKSVILYSFPEFRELMLNHIIAVLAEVQTALNISSFSITDIEAQLTGHNDGNYYKLHNDNGSPDTATRELTYVYYFYREPKGFSGGELVLYDSRIENGYYVQAESFHRVEPRNNTVVFFPSRCLHEVLPVTCPTRQFVDSRFTINGWIRRA